jgi:hypothetical protein
MRFIQISALVLLFVLVLGGCQMRVEQRFEVNDDGSGTVKVVTLFDEEAQEFVTFGMGFEAIVQDAPAGFEVELVEDGNMAGTAMSAGFSALDEIPALTQELAEEGGMGAVNVRKTGDAFIFQMTLPDDGLTVDGNDMGDFGDFADFEGFGELEDAIQFRVVAVLPGHIEDSNADEVDGDTAVWNISMLSPPTELLHASSLPGSSQSFPILWIVAGVAVVALIILVLRSWQRPSPAPVAEAIPGASPEAPVVAGSAPTEGPIAPSSDD